MPTLLAQPPCRFHSQAVWPAGLRQDQTWPVFNLDGERIGEQQLPGTVFDVPIRRDILQRVVQWQLARRQQVKQHPLSMQPPRQCRAKASHHSSALHSVPTYNPHAGHA